jgi:serine/threonine-protein kinase
MVYRARHRGLGRVVALKTIPPAHLAAPSARARFLPEASVAGRLDHPNIVPIYEVGERDGFSFFSMKLVEGITLQQLFPDGPPQISGCRQAADILIKVSRKWLCLVFMNVAIDAPSGARTKWRAIAAVYPLAD